MVETRADQRYVGRDYGSRQTHITPELVKHYAESVDDHNSWYFGDSPFGGPVAPALVLHSEVYKDVSWYLPNGRTHQSFLLESGGEVVVDKERERRGDRRFEVGVETPLEEIAGPVKRITLEMCQKFSGPHKNYHNDVEAARKLGFPDIVVQGMMPVCFVSEMMTARFGEGWYRGGRMNVSLVNVVWPSDELTCRGHVTELTPEGSLRRAHLQVWCEKADGTKVIVGTASAVVP